MIYCISGPETAWIALWIWKTDFVPLREQTTALRESLAYSRNRKVPTQSYSIMCCTRKIDAKDLRLTWLREGNIRNKNEENDSFWKVISTVNYILGIRTALLGYISDRSRLTFLIKLLYESIVGYIREPRKYSRSTSTPGIDRWANSCSRVVLLARRTHASLVFYLRFDTRCEWVIEHPLHSMPCAKGVQAPISNCTPAVLYRHIINFYKYCSVHGADLQIPILFQVITDQPTC